MSNSSGSSGGKTISSAEAEDLKQIVRELSLLDQLRAGDHKTTPNKVNSVAKPGQRYQTWSSFCVLHR
jgi:hypothetical protein